MQVTPNSVILLLESEMVQTLPVDLGSPIGRLSILSAVICVNISLFTSTSFVPKDKPYVEIKIL